MGSVLSFALARSEKVKAKLFSFAETRAPGMVETRDGPISAQRIFCRDATAVLIDRYGVQTRLSYGEITDVSPIVPVAEIIQLAQWQVEAAPEAEGASVVPFPAR